MKHLEFSIGSKDDTNSLYEKLLDRLEAPSWHGRNLDALWDTISGDDINGIRAPFSISVVVESNLPQEIQEVFPKIERIFHDANEDGLDVRIELINRGNT